MQSPVSRSGSCRSGRRRSAWVTFGNRCSGCVSSLIVARPQPFGSSSEPKIRSSGLPGLTYGRTKAGPRREGPAPLPATHRFYAALEPAPARSWKTASRRRRRAAGASRLVRVRLREREVAPLRVALVGVCPLDPDRPEHGVVEPLGGGAVRDPDRHVVEHAEESLLWTDC